MPQNEAPPQPNKALFLLTTVNYLNYIDRYILAAVLVSIKADLGLSDFQAGLLATAFMIPYMFTSPFFGYLGDKNNRSKIISVGAAVWSFASVLTGQASQFVVMAASRFLLGIGESAFTVTSVPYLSDYFPEEKRGRILSIFSTALPVGAALGFILGGLMGKFFGWRMAFFVGGLPGLLLAYLIWKLPDPGRGKEASTSDLNLRKSFAALFRSKNYLLVVLGYCAYTFVVGGVAHWVPTYLQRAYAIDQMKANVIFGGIAVISGFLGTMVGGYWGDAETKKHRHGHIKISSYSMFLAMPFYVACLMSESLLGFAIWLSLAQFFFFVSTSPINITIIDVAPWHFRTSAMAMAVFACHILGDAISSPLIGWVSDQTGSLKIGMLACSPIILVSAALWLMAARLPRNSLPGPELKNPAL